MTSPSNPTPPSPSPKETPNLDILGRSGLPYYGGRIYAERLVKLRGIQGVRLYQEMSENDAVIGMLIYLFETWIATAEWRIEPAREDDETALQWAKFVEECLEDMSHTWEDCLSEILTMITYGWSFFELCYKVRGGESDDPTQHSKHGDGKIGWRKIAPRAQDSFYAWDLDADGGLRGFYQSAPPDFIITYIPIEKAVLFRTKIIHGNPEGRSMLRNSVRPYHFVKRMQEVEAVGTERDLVGYPVMQVPEELLMKNANPVQVDLRNQLRDLIVNVRRDEREGVLVPSEMTSEGKPTGYKLSLMTSGGRRALDLDGIIKRYETRISQTVLAEFSMIGTEQVGSYSLITSKTNSFGRSLGALMDRISSVFNRYAIPRLLKLNGCDPQYYPTMKHGDLDTPDLSEIVQYVTGLSQAGLDMSDPRTERKLREFANLPQREEGDMPGALSAVPHPSGQPGQSAQGTPEQQQPALPPGVHPANTMHNPNALPLQAPSQLSTAPVESEHSVQVNPWSGSDDGEGDEYLQQNQRFFRPPPIPSLDNTPLPLQAPEAGFMRNLMDIVRSAARQDIPRSSALHMILLQFPALSPQQAELLLADSGTSFTQPPTRNPGIDAPPPFDVATMATPALPPLDNRPGPKQPISATDPSGRDAKPADSADPGGYNPPNDTDKDARDGKR